MGQEIVLSMQAVRQTVVTFFSVKTLIGGGSCDQWKLHQYQRERNHLDSGRARETESRDPLRVSVPDGYCAFQFHDVLRGKVVVDELTLDMGGASFNYSPLYFVTGVVKTIEQARQDVQHFGDWGYEELKKQGLGRVIGLLSSYYKGGVGTIWLPMANEDEFIERPLIAQAA